MIKKYGGYVMMGKDNRIKAVHDDDLPSFLASLDILDDVDHGRAKCSFCGEIINRENIVAVLPMGGTIGFCCDKPLCYLKMMENQE